MTNVGYRCLFQLNLGLIQLDFSFSVTSQERYQLPIMVCNGFGYAIAVSNYEDVVNYCFDTIKTFDGLIQAALKNLSCWGYTEWHAFPFVVTKGCDEGCEER